jgi:predicted enzyme related to lactoylglutathione lyase
MATVIGVGGVFFKARDPQALRAWYERVLGLEMQDWNGTVFLPQTMVEQPGAGTVFSLFPEDTDYFEPSTKPFMINLAVDDLAGILERAKGHGVEPVRSFEDQPNGRFAHIVDPEGTTLELWEPAPMA